MNDARQTTRQNARQNPGQAAPRRRPALTPDSSEHYHQAWFVQWFRLQYPRVRIMAIPNGGARGAAQAGKLKAEGVSPGVPDLFIPEWCLWIEMKRAKGGTVSPEQQDWHAYLTRVGYRVMVCRGFEDAQAQVRTFATQEGITHSPATPPTPTEVTHGKPR